jgi:hypothetical protein
MTENEYLYNLRKMLLQTWEMTGVSMEADSKARSEMMRGKYRPYAKGDLFYLTTIPKRQLVLSLDRIQGGIRRREARTISSKLQLRFTGPYRVLKVINPETYVADIHNVEIVVVAVHMKAILLRKGGE